MTAVDDLAAWLDQVLKADQAAAQACDEVYPSPWELSDRGWVARIKADEPTFRVVAELEQDPSIDGWLGDRLAHIAQNDPATVLARIAAHRQILADYVYLLNDRDRLTNVRSDACWRTVQRVVKILAAAYAARPGYREEWRP